MKRWQKITIWVASILIVLVVGGLFAANYAVDKVLNSMVGMSVDDLLSEEASNEAGSNNQGNSSSNGSGDLEGTETDPNGSDTTSTDGTNGTNGTNSGSNPDESVSNSNEEHSGGSKQPDSNGNGQSGSNGSGNNSNSGNNSSSDGTSGYNPEVSTDKAKEVEENITLSDKAKVVSTLMSSLSASDISTLQKLANGGLNLEEKKQARSILLEKLTEDQYNELIAIAAKHGLSEGRSYAEVKDE